MTVPSLYPIDYKVTRGRLPLGLFMMDDGSIKGSVAYGNFYDTPQWKTPSGRLLTTNELEAIENIQLECEPTAEFNEVVYSLVPSPITGEVLPWGLYLDWRTGIISGFVMDYLPPNEPHWLPEEEPVWKTKKGSVGTVDEYQDVNIKLNVETFNNNSVSFCVYEGNLPFGMYMDSKTGELKGKIARLSKNDAIGIEYPKPKWVSSSSLGNFLVEDVVDVPIQAVAIDNLLKSYTIIGGVIPFGLDINYISGKITGKLSRFTNDYEPFLNTINVGFPNGTTIINSTIGETVNYQIPATPTTWPIKWFSVNRNSNSLSNLPFGLVLNRQTGVISGTIGEQAQVGTYNIQLNIIDSKDYKTTTTFKIRIGMKK